MKLHLCVVGLLLTGCSIDNTSVGTSDARPGLMSVSQVAASREANARRVIRIEGFIIHRGEYIALISADRSNCNPSDPDENFVVIDDLNRSVLDEIGLVPFGAGRRVIIEGSFKNERNPLPLEVNRISTEGWEGPIGPLVDSRIISVFDERCRIGDPGDTISN